MASTFMTGQYQCQIPRLLMSANGILINDDHSFFEWEPVIGTNNIQACFQEIDPFLIEFGEVKEVLVQEYCPVNVLEICANLSFFGHPDFVHVFGSRGILSLVPSGTGLLNSNISTLRNGIMYYISHCTAPTILKACPDSIHAH